MYQNTLLNLPLRNGNIGPAPCADTATCTLESSFKEWKLGIRLYLRRALGTLESSFKEWKHESEAGRVLRFFALESSFKEWKRVFVF